MQPVRLDLSKAQAKKLLTGGKVRVSHAKMGKGAYNYHLSPAQMKKMKSCHGRNCGMDLQYSPEEAHHSVKHGGGLWDWVKGAAKAVGHTAESLAPILKPLIKKYVKPLAKQGLDSALTFGAEAVGLNPEISKYGMQGANYLFDEGTKKMGIGIRQKGTPAMHAKMARIRAAKSGTGGMYR